MNAKQIKNQTNEQTELNLTLAPIEKVERPSLWSRIVKSLSAPDMNLETWERLEMKRSRSSFRDPQNWGPF